MDSSHNEENEASRKRLQLLASRLTGEQLAMEMDGGWTVAAYFAHLAFFDRRVLELLRRFDESGFYDSPIDLHVINDALLPQQRLIPARAAVDDALAAAEAADRAVANLPKDLEQQILEASPRTLARCVHHNTHLNELEPLFA